MELRKNSFKAALREGRQQIGLWCTLPGGSMAELIAGCGFDWMLIDTEHSAIDLPMVQTMLQAAAPYPVQAAARPGSLDVVEIKRLLDVGAQTIIVPYVQSVDEAERAVAAVRYPPQGIRGVAGVTRASGFGAIEGYAGRAAEETCLIVQVETANALEQVEAIAAVEGVDGVFIGPADLAASMGYLGQGGHPEVRKAVLSGVRRIRAAGKPAGVLALDPGFLADLIEAGTIFTAVGLDAALLRGAARGLVEKWKG